MTLIAGVIIGLLAWPVGLFFKILYKELKQLWQGRAVYTKEDVRPYVYPLLLFLKRFPDTQSADKTPVERPRKILIRVCHCELPYKASDGICNFCGGEVV